MNFKIILLLFTYLLIGCGGNSDRIVSNEEYNPLNTNYVNWESIPRDYKPSIDEVTFRTDDVDKINIDIFGFDKDVEIIYSKNVPSNEGALRVFKVWGKQASWGDLRPKSNGRTLDLINYGSYQCSIRVENSQIIALEGGCYVKAQLFLPAGAEIEVYNVGQLITKRYIPINNEDFFEALNDAVWDYDKFAVIENFLASYSGSRKPSLTSYEIGKIIEEFIRSEDKFKALRRIHSAVSDRQNLASLINNKFSFFDREEALQIVGLN